ncbi:MAG: type II secretion system protein GspM [Rhodoferax sp.]
MRSAREKTGLRLGGALVAVALLWWVALSPALRTLRDTQVRGPALQAQMHTMLQLQARAQALQAQPKLPAADSKALLESALPALGASARMTVSGESATVTLEGSTADALAQWLTQVRLNAHARPLEMHLSRSQGLWSGRVVLQWAGASAP